MLPRCPLNVFQHAAPGIMQAGHHVLHLASCKLVSAPHADEAIQAAGEQLVGELLQV